MYGVASVKQCKLALKCCIKIQCLIEGAESEIEVGGESVDVRA